jgi:hypothetical protein
MAFITSGLIGHNLAATVAGTTTNGAGAPIALGTRALGNDGTEWVFVQAGAAITQYDCVLIDEDYQAQPITSTLATEADTSSGDLIGFAQVAFSDNDFGWVAVKGSNIRARLAASCVAHTMLYTTGTAGVLDDLSAGVLINGVVSCTTITAATNAEIIASNPVSRLAAGLAS